MEPCPTGADELKACKRRRRKCPAGSSGSLTAVAAAVAGAAAGEAAAEAADGVIKGRPEIVEAVAVDIKAVAAVDIKAAAAVVDIKAAAEVTKAAAAVDIKVAAAEVTKAAAEVKFELKFLSDFLNTKISNKFRKIACKFSR